MEKSREICVIHYQKPKLGEDIEDSQRGFNH